MMLIIPFGQAEEYAAQQLIRLGIAEDLGQVGDITSQAVIPHDLQGIATFVARSVGVLSGTPIIQMICNTVDPSLRLELRASDGSALQPRQSIATLSGSMRSILAVERIALNFLQKLSGIATQTSKYVEEVKETKCQVLDTRKTTPGWRVLEKYAVRCGGGHNHRMGLFDAVMIKDNHLAGLRHHGTPLAEAVRQARAVVGHKVIVEVEVESLEQLKEALTAHPDVILLDNMKVDMLRQAVDIRNRTALQTRLEASGGITLTTLKEVARTGVDCVSVGALTHSAPAL
ncbi:MAG: carboxylating nicotinate-nucleotide diphosphorylase [Gemmatales bacterium]